MKIKKSVLFVKKKLKINIWIKIVTLKIIVIIQGNI